MNSQFDELTTAAELEYVFVQSERAPRVLYLHDPYCGLSTAAHVEVSQLGVRVAWINVHARHDLGMDVERLTGVRHESPQAIVLKDRQARWSASHRKVTASAILAALGAAKEPGLAPPPVRDRWAELRNLIPGFRRRTTES